MEYDVSDGDILLGELTTGVNIVAASVARGKQQLVTADEYLNHQSRFDREARASISPGLVDDTTLQALYLGYLANQVMPWQANEISLLKDIVNAMSLQYHLLSQFTLPATVYLVKTTGKEEGYAAYTRQLDTIVLPANMVASLQTTLGYGDPLHPANDTQYLQSIITHESFHVFSKHAYVHDPLRLATLYGSIGYQFCDNELVLPDVPWPEATSTTRMPELKITNPDSPCLNSYVQMQTPDSGGQSVPLMPVLMADRAYSGGAFFDYLSWYVMQIERGADGLWRACLSEQGRPVMYLMTDPENKAMMREYLSLVGYNLTHEIFQADEVLAQNFVLLMTRTLPSQSILNQLEHFFNS